MADKKDRRLHGFERIGGILQDALKPYRAQFEDELGAVLRLWPQIAGVTVGAHCAPIGLRGGTLIIKTDSAAWMHHLQFLKQDIIAGVNNSLNRHLIDDIHFTIKD